MSSPPRILLANDDGHAAAGLHALEAAFAELDSGEIWVVAPDRERSATSNAISIREELQLLRRGERRFSLSGFPADCVNVALHSELLPNFDLVVSGINHGPNLGDDVHYSGTVAAARQAAVHNLPGVAISYADYTPTDAQLAEAARWLAGWLQTHRGELLAGLVYNINFPHRAAADAADDISGPELRYTYQGKRTYHDEYAVRPGDSDGEWWLQIKETAFGHVKQDHSDSEAVIAGHISITPLSTFTTDRRELRKWFHRTRTRAQANQ